MRRRDLSGLVVSIGWSGIDQGLSAISNLLVTVAVARFAGAEALGRFSVMFALYLVCLGVSRALAAEPLLAARPEPGEKHEGAAFTTTLCWSLLAGTIVVIAGLWSARAELVALGVSMPFLLSQDVLRFVAFARHRPQQAAVLDGVWAACSIVVWARLESSDGSTAATAATSGWAVGAATALVAGLAVLGVRPAAIRTALGWWRRKARPLSLPLLADTLVVAASAQAAVLVISWRTSDGDLGLLRAGQVYFAPVGLMLTALGTSVVPRLARRPNGLDRASVFRLSASLCAGAAAVSVAVLLLSDHLHRLLFSDRVQVPGTFLVPLSVQTMLAGACAGLLIGVRVRSRGQDLFRSRVYTSLGGLALVVTGTTAFGVLGAAWATAAQAAWFFGDLARRSWRPAPSSAGVCRTQPSTDCTVEPRLSAVPAGGDRTTAAAAGALDEGEVSR